MTKPLSTYPEDQRKKVRNRRLAGDTMGLGYWGAFDALRHSLKEGRQAIQEALDEIKAAVKQSKMEE
jgi:hypothetical protein